MMRGLMNRQMVLFWTLAVILASSAAYLTMRATSLYGLGLSIDSTGYLRLAKDILVNGFAFLSEHKAVSQPPVYPALLAFLSRMTRADLLDVARGLNVTAAFVLVVIIMLIVKRVTTFMPVVMVIGILAAFSLPLHHVLSMAWTEPLFLMSISALFLLITGSRQEAWVALLAGLLTTVACLTRYAGITLIPLVSAYLFFLRRGTLTGRLKYVFTYAIVPGIVFTLYLARNWTISGTLFGTRVASQTGLKKNLDLATNTFLSWFLSSRMRSFDTLMLGAFILLGAVIWSRRAQLSIVLGDARRVVALCGTFTLVYTAFIVWTSTTTAYDGIGDRLLAPAYPSLLVLCASCLKPDVWGGRIGSLVALCGFCMFCVVAPVLAAVSNANAKANTGAGGYNSRMWQESDLFAYLKQNGQSKGEVVFSNVPYALEIIAGISANLSPAKRWYNSKTTTGITADNVFDKTPAFDGALLIWFKHTRSDYLFTLEDLELMCNLQPVRRFSDGAIYRVGRFTLRNGSEK